ncbi:MAG: hypothetical protein OSA45_14890 [Halioglobus sp.]|nr:hypothetical protein [Halioglobus sp.]
MAALLACVGPEKLAVSAGLVSSSGQLNVLKGVTHLLFTAAE